MAHSNTCSYPLAFPTEDHLVRISSYSSLANALGTDPGFTSRSRTHLAARNVVTDARPIFWGSPPVGNRSYPYPPRNVFSSSSYPTKTPATDGKEKEPLRFLSQYECLPQPFVWENQVGPACATVHFVRKGNEEPYTIQQLLTMSTMPDLVGGDLPVLVQSPERWIKVKLNWPGYSHAFEKRIPIKRSAPLTRTLLLMALAYHIEEFARRIQNEGAISETGHERWAVAGREAPMMWKNCIITCLQHRTGSTWQPEIYYPRA